MIDFNKDELVVAVTEYFTWDHVEYHFNNIVTEIKQWEDDEKGDNADAVDSFIEDCNTELTHQEKVEIMEYIIDYWDFNNDETSTLWDSDVIREGIFQWIENNYYVDVRCDDLSRNWW